MNDSNEKAKQLACRVMDKTMGRLRLKRHHGSWFKVTVPRPFYAKINSDNAQRLEDLLVEFEERIKKVLNEG